MVFSPNLSNVYKKKTDVSPTQAHRPLCYAPRRTVLTHTLTTERATSILREATRNPSPHFGVAYWG